MRLPDPDRLDQLDAVLGLVGIDVRLALVIVRYRAGCKHIGQLAHYLIHCSWL